MKKTAYPLLILAAALMLPACYTRLPVPAGPEVIAKLTEPDDQKHPVTIVTGDYGGGFRLDKSDQLFSPGEPIYLTPGTHNIDVASVDRSLFTFDVLPCGKVCNVSNPNAAYAKGTSLVFRTTPVTIDPGRLGDGGNACELVAYPHKEFKRFIRKRETFSLIPGLVYQFDSGIRAGKSAFLFEVRDDGTVWGDWRAGNGLRNGSTNTLRLNVGWLSVTAPSNAPYRIGVSDTYQGTKRVPVIFGLETSFMVGGKEFRFTPDYGATSGELSPWRFRVGGEIFTVTMPWEQ